MIGPVSPSVQSQPLNGGVPRRLSHEAGRWVLEVVRHVNLGQGLIRPTTQRLTGHRVITSYFRSNPDQAPLGKAAERLMQGDDARQPRSYTAVGGDWVVNSMAPGPGESLESVPAPGRTPSLDTHLDELRAQVILLTAVQEGLLTRVARLEARLARGVGPSAAASVLEGPAPSSASASRAPVPVLRPAEDEESSPGADFSLAPHTPEAPGDWSTPDEAAREQPAEVAPAPADPATPAEQVELELPAAVELARCITSLMGGDVVVSEGPALAVNRTTKDCYCAGLLDATDRAVGLILMDLKATVYLGGTLMMLPASELEQQLQAQSPGEDSLAASAEICSALSNIVNQLRREPLRLARLEKFEFRSWGWAKEPALRRDLQDSFGGRVSVLSRPAPTQIF